jgi:hypothetical protein
LTRGEVELSVSVDHPRYCAILAVNDGVVDTILLRIDTFPAVIQAIGEMDIPGI